MWYNNPRNTITKNKMIHDKLYCNLTLKQKMLFFSTQKQTRLAQNDHYFSDHMAIGQCNHYGKKPTDI